MASNSPRFAADLIRKACAEGEPVAIAELASSVENALSWRNRRVEGGETTPVVRHGEISDSDAGHFLYRLVRACGEHGHAPPRELIRLVQTFTKQDRPANVIIAPTSRAQRRSQRSAATLGLSTMVTSWTGSLGKCRCARPRSGPNEQAGSRIAADRI